MKQPFLKKVLAAGLSIVLLLLLCEGAGRVLQARARKQHREITEKSVYRPHPLLGYALKPDLDTLYGRTTPLRTNSLGFREREFEPEKPDGVFRVICIGDSRTFGLGIEPGETFSMELERLLKKAHPGKRVEVINAGVPGYTSREGAILAEEVLPPLRPDLVIASFGHNDRWKSPHREAEIAALIGSPTGRQESGMRTFLKSMDDLLDSVLGYFDLKVKLRGVSRSTPLASRTIEEEFRTNVPLDLYEKNLRRMARAADEGGFRLLFMHLTENPAIFDRTERGAGLLEEGRIEEAEAELLEAAAVPVNFSPAPYYYLGLIHEQRGNEKAAEEAFRRAEFGARIYPHPLRLVMDIFRRRGITKGERSPDEIARMEPVAHPYGIIDAYAGATRRAAEEEGVPFLIIGRDDATGAHYIDANHPSAEGNEFLARQALERI